MRRVAFIAVVVGALPGCFYFDSINQRPSVQIVNDSGEGVQRGAMVSLHAAADDPEGDPIKFEWYAFACTDAALPETCDNEAFTSSATNTFNFTVADMRMEAPLINQSVLVTLNAKDRYNAKATPHAELIIPLEDIPPTLELAKQSTYDYVVGTPVRLLAKVGDSDDGPMGVTLEWAVDPPLATGFVGTLVDATPATITDPDDPKHVQFAKLFTANDPGEWTVRVKASDPLNNEENQAITINVVEDQAPCLAQLAPAVPPTGVALPLSQATLFRVPVVKDDLDPYPLIPNDPIFRATTFRWSIKNPGSSTHVQIAGANGNSFPIDPASYAPGDIVELRVQIYDRKATAIPCPDGDASCSTISEPTCLQRQTWRVEIR